MHFLLILTVCCFSLFGAEGVEEERFGLSAYVRSFMGSLFGIGGIAEEDLNTTAPQAVCTCPEDHSGLIANMKSFVVSRRGKAKAYRILGKMSNESLNATIAANVPYEKNGDRNYDLFLLLYGAIHEKRPVANLVSRCGLESAYQLVEQKLADAFYADYRQRIGADFCAEMYGVVTDPHFSWLAHVAAAGDISPDTASVADRRKRLKKTFTCP